MSNIEAELKKGDRYEIGAVHSAKDVKHLIGVVLTRGSYEPLECTLEVEEAHRLRTLINYAINAHNKLSAPPRTMSEAYNEKVGP